MGTKEGSILAADSNKPCKPLPEEENNLVLDIKLARENETSEEEAGYHGHTV